MRWCRRRFSDIVLVLPRACTLGQARLCIDRCFASPLVLAGAPAQGLPVTQDVCLRPSASPPRSIPFLYTCSSTFPVVIDFRSILAHHISELWVGGSHSRRIAYLCSPEAELVCGGEMLFQLDPCGTGTGSRLLLWILSRRIQPPSVSKPRGREELLCPRMAHGFWGMLPDHHPWVLVPTTPCVVFILLVFPACGLQGLPSRPNSLLVLVRTLSSLDSSMPLRVGSCP